VKDIDRNKYLAELGTPVDGREIKLRHLVREGLLAPLVVKEYRDWALLRCIMSDRSTVELMDALIKEYEKNVTKATKK